jgi:hypothetical protein
MPYCLTSPCTAQEASAYIAGAVGVVVACITIAANYFIFTRTANSFGNAKALADRERERSREIAQGLAQEEHARKLQIDAAQREHEKDMKLYEANFETIRKNQSAVMERLRKFQAAAEKTEERASPLAAQQSTLVATRGTPQEEEIAQSIIKGAGALLRAAAGVFAERGQGEPHLPSHFGPPLRKLQLSVIRVLLLLNYESQQGKDAKAVEMQMGSAMIELHKCVVHFSREVEAEQAKVITKRQVMEGSGLACKTM